MLTLLQLLEELVGTLAKTLGSAFQMIGRTLVEALKPLARQIGASARSKLEERQARAKEQKKAQKKGPPPGTK